jgi:putative two-component system response regulator
MINTNEEILIVDDVRENIKLLESFLVGNYKVRTALDGKTALLSIDARKPDLILLDINMPNMDGYAVAKHLQSNADTKDIPIIFISGNTDTKDKVKAFSSGGVDYITKPFANEEVLARVKMHLELSDYRHSLENKVQEGLSSIKNLNNELRLTQNEIIFAMGAVAEEHSDETGKHVKRVGEYSFLLAKLINLDEATCSLIHQASPMHDIGKVGIPDNILHKPGSLTPEEWEIMKTHAQKGYHIFEHTTRPVLIMAGTIAREHHERWDGKGYPNGLKEKEINIAGRIVILADVFDALSNERCYKKAWSLEKTKEFIIENRTIMFDPELVDLFIENFDKFVEIHQKYR